MLVRPDSYRFVVIRVVSYRFVFSNFDPYRFVLIHIDSCGVVLVRICSRWRGATFNALLLSEFGINHRQLRSSLERF